MNAEDVTRFYSIWSMAIGTLFLVWLTKILIEAIF